MRASFSSRDVDNHTAFIRIKTNAPNEDQFIILPVEVEVTSGVLLNLCATVLFNHYSLLTLVFHSLFAAPGIYSSTEMLDFGTLRSQGLLSLKKRHLSVFSFSNRPPTPPSDLCLLLPHVADRPKLLNLHLLNSGTKDVPITVRIQSKIKHEHNSYLKATKNP